jgi:histone-lysine N-methyltransferase SETMAR
MLQEAFRDNAMSQSKTFLWYKHFKDGRMSVDDDEHSGRSSTGITPENIAKVLEVILADRRHTIRDVCEIVRLSCGTVQHILADNLNMRRISATFVPRLLSDDQKALCISVCREQKQQARDDPNFISNITTGDETLVYGYDPETKQRSSQWTSPNSPWPKKARQVRSNVKSMLIVFFNIQGTVHKEFVPLGQTINGNFYCEVLKWLREGIWRKHPDKWKKNNWFLHHDNAPTHISLVVRQFLTSKNVTVIPHPPIHLTSSPVTFSYSPR